MHHPGKNFCFFKKNIVEQWIKQKISYVNVAASITRLLKLMHRWQAGSSALPGLVSKKSASTGWPACVVWVLRWVGLKQQRVISCLLITMTFLSAWHCTQLLHLVPMDTFFVNAYYHLRQNLDFTDGHLTSIEARTTPIYYRKIVKKRLWGGLLSYIFKSRWPNWPFYSLNQDKSCEAYQGKLHP